MKKLNRKGFTLVELLAVIVILAIVIGITIPAVTSTMNTSKVKGFETAVANAASYLQKQYDTYVVDANLAEPEFTDIYDKLTAPNGAGGTKQGIGVELVDSQIAALGLKTSNVTDVYACMTTEGRFIVAVTKVPKGSEYFTPNEWTTSGEFATPKSGEIAYYAGRATATFGSTGALTTCQ